MISRKEQALKITHILDERLEGILGNEKYGTPRKDNRWGELMHTQNESNYHLWNTFYSANGKEKTILIKMWINTDQIIYEFIDNIGNKYKSKNVEEVINIYLEKFNSIKKENSSMRKFFKKLKTRIYHER